MYIHNTYLYIYTILCIYTCWLLYADPFRSQFRICRGAGSCLREIHASPPWKPRDIHGKSMGKPKQNHSKMLVQWNFMGYTMFQAICCWDIS